MSTPTPTPRPEWITAAAEAIEEAAWPRIGRDLGTVHRDEIVAAGLRAVLPLIRAEVAEETHQDIARQLDMLASDDQLIARWTQTCDPVPLTVADWFRALASKLRAPAESAVEPSAVPVEGSGQAPESCPSCGATVWPAATPWTDDYRRLVLGKSAEGSGHPRRPRCLCDAGGVQCALSAGHVPPCAPMRPLDTPEGATTNEH